MDGRRRPSLSRPGGTALLGCLIVATTLGFASAAALKISDDGTIRDVGNYVSTSGVGAWWVSTKVAVTTIPGTVPPTVSTTAGTPTVLPSSATSYVINAATAGSKALVWTFVETTAAPANTELELTFNITVNTGAPVSILAFVETQASAPGANLTLQFYYQTGVVTLTKIVVQSFAELSEQCTAIGTCP